jgi:hypothetical protein
MLSSHLCPGPSLTSSHFWFPHQNSACITLIPAYASCPAHLKLCVSIPPITFIKQHKSVSLSLCSVHHPPVSYSLLSTLPLSLSLSLSPCPSLNLTDPNKTTNYITVLHILSNSPSTHYSITILQLPAALTVALSAHFCRMP